MKTRERERAHARLYSETTFLAEVRSRRGSTGAAGRAQGGGGREEDWDWDRGQSAYCSPWKMLFISHFLALGTLLVMEIVPNKALSLSLSLAQPLKTLDLNEVSRYSHPHSVYYYWTMYVY